MSLYFDHAAATPVDPVVLEAMMPYLSEQFHNPSALYLAGRKSKAALDEARASVASVLGARPSEIIFTAGGTESCNLAVRGIMARYPNANAVTSAVEHDAVLLPVQKYQHTLAPVGSDGAVTVAAIAAAINDDTVLVSAMYANNEVGTIQPIADIARHIETVRAQRRERGVSLPLYLHTDACQAAGTLDIHVSRLGVDLLTINGGKMYGPKQSGVLYVRGGIVLEPTLYGGGQEAGLRSGTENVAACVGLAVALRKADAGRHDEARRLRALRDHFMQRVEAAGITINGSRRNRLAGNVHLTISGGDNERLLMELDERGIQAAAGSACSASSDKPSHVLRAMGMSDADAQASLRFTLGRGTDQQSVDTAVDTLLSLVA